MSQIVTAKTRDHMGRRREGNANVAQMAPSTSINRLSFLGNKTSSAMAAVTRMVLGKRNRPSDDLASTGNTPSFS